MKKYLCAAFMIMPIMIGTANAITPYFSAGGSIGLGDTKQIGFAGALGVRYRISGINMRTEFEFNDVTYRKDIEYTTAAGRHKHEYDQKTQLYLGNIIADFRGPILRTSLHAGITIGAASYTRDIPQWMGDDGRTTRPVYGAMAGIGARIFAGIHANAGVRYLRTADGDAVDSFAPYVNLRYGF